MSSWNLMNLEAYESTILDEPTLEPLIWQRCARYFLLHWTFGDGVIARRSGFYNLLVDMHTYSNKLKLTSSHTKTYEQNKRAKILKKKLIYIHINRCWYIICIQIYLFDFTSLQNYWTVFVNYHHFPEKVYCFQKVNFSTCDFN